MVTIVYIVRKRKQICLCFHYFLDLMTIFHFSSSKTWWIVFECALVFKLAVGRYIWQLAIIHMHIRYEENLL